MSLNNKRAKALEILTNLQSQANTAAAALAGVHEALANAENRLTILAENAAIKGDTTNSIDLELVTAMTVQITGRVNAYNLKAKITLPPSPVAEIESASESI